MAGFVLKNTLSDNGGVTRGICKMDAEHNLTEVVETKNIRKTADGAEADGNVLDIESLVSMNMWGLTPDFLKVLEAGSDCVKVQFQFGIPTVPGASAELVYTVEAQGALRVDAVYHGVAGAPELPCFGVKFETFGPVTRTVWTGLSGETYPDRYKGGVFGCHEETPHVEPHLVPQDCGMHMQTRQAMLEQRDACGHTTAALTLQQVDAPFAFSALPNTAQEIEAAQHITELPATGRTSVMVLGAVRGVGGIDSWGTDVEEPYHVSGEEDHSVSFRIVL